MSDVNDKFVTCFTTMDPMEAKAVRAYLESYDIQCFLPEENLTSVAWHLTGAVGGARVLVMRSQLEEAKKALENYISIGFKSPDEPDGDSESLVSDSFAFRAFKTAIVGMILWPFLHPYAIYLALRALGQWGNLTTKERITGIFTLIFSSLNVVGAAILIYSVHYK